MMLLGFHVWYKAVQEVFKVYGINTEMPKAYPKLFEHVEPPHEH